MADTELLDTTAGAAFLEEIEALLASMWSTHSAVPATVRTQMGIAAVEIGANIVKHAAGGRPVRITMQVEVLRDQVRVVFADEGIPAQVDLDGVSMPGPLAENGRGLALARAALGQLCYRRNTVNHWTLVSKPF